MENRNCITVKDLKDVLNEFSDDDILYPLPDFFDRANDYLEDETLDSFIMVGDVDADYFLGSAIKIKNTIVVF